jgi:hypothetical protein
MAASLTALASICSFDSILARCNSAAKRLSGCDRRICSQRYYHRKGKFQEIQTEKGNKRKKITLKR